MSSKFDIEAFGETHLERFTKSAGDEWTAVCPSCEGWSCWYVNEKSGAFVCFKCDFKGKNAIGLVALVLDLTWAEASKHIFTNQVKLRRRTDAFTLIDRIRGLRNKDRPSEDDPINVELPVGFKPVWDEKKGWSYPTYLKERGITRDTAKTWGMGYVRFGELSDRLVIPINCPNGFSWTARAMKPGVEPRYYNPPEAPQSRLFIGWNVANLRGDVCIVEGPFDAVKFHQHGIQSLACGGKVLHSEQLNMLFTLSPEQAITVCLDPEERVAPYDVADQLLVHFNRVYVARLPMGIDPGDSKKSVAVETMRKAKRYKGSRSARLAASVEAAREAVKKRYC